MKEQIRKDPSVIILENNDIETNTSFDLLCDDSTLLQQQREEQKKVTLSQLKSIFEIASQNVKEATIIFNKNIEMRKQIEREQQDLLVAKKLLEQERQEELQKIKEYREEVLHYLDESKNDLEQMRSQIKISETVLAKEKRRFEKKRSTDIEHWNKQKKEQEEKLQQERKKLQQEKEQWMKDVQKWEEEKQQFEQEKLLYEQDKLDLTGSLEEFNQVVGDFTVGIDRFNIE